MSNFSIHPVESSDKDWVKQFIAEHWSADIVVSRGVIHHPHDLSGFVAIQDKRRVGLITHNIENSSCEIVTLDSVQQSLGVGTALIKEVEKVARQSGCKRLWFVTTNDNLNALRFYQKRGFVLAAVHINELEKSRKLKPEIPLTGIDGIPLRDEIELEKMLYD